MVKETIEKILETLRENLAGIDQQSVDDFLTEIVGAKRVMVVGAGRSGLVGKAFAMRLMHLGFDVYVVGDTVTPAVEEGDVLLAISGSGETSSVRVCVEAALKNGARVVALSGEMGSPIARLADVVVEIPSALKKKKKNRSYEAGQLAGDDRTVTPLGTIFELSCMIFGDGVIAELMKEKKVSEGEMGKRHANLE